MSRSLTFSLAALIVPALMLGAAACSSSNNNNSSNNSVATTGATTVSTRAALATTVTTPAASASTAGSPAALGPVVTPSAQVSATPGAAPAIVEVATDNAYSVTRMAAPAGKPLTVIVENKGAIHNWHLMGAKDASGKDIATPLQQGPNTFSVTFTINTPGTYNFICDAHPADMKGTLTIQ